MTPPPDVRAMAQNNLRRQAQDAMLYRLARHVRDTDAMPAVEWCVRAGELLAELRAIDPQRYEREVKGTPDEQHIPYCRTRERVPDATRTPPADDKATDELTDAELATATDDMRRQEDAYAKGHYHPGRMELYRDFARLTWDAVKPRVEALVAERDAMPCAAREAEDAHDRADNALCSIHRALWPRHRTDWVFGEATGMAPAIVDGVGKLIAERDTLRRAVDWLGHNDHGTPMPDWVLTLVNGGATAPAAGP